MCETGCTDSELLPPGGTLRADNIFLPIGAFGIELVGFLAVLFIGIKGGGVSCVCSVRQWREWRVELS